MSNEQARQDISAYLNDNWATTVIKWPNKKFTQPKTEWVRLDIKTGDSLQISMGSTHSHRTVLVINVAIFGKDDTGTKTLNEYADTLQALFTNKTIGIVHTRSASINEVGEQGDWFMFNVTVDAWYDRTVTT